MLTRNFSRVSRWLFVICAVLFQVTPLFAQEPLQLNETCTVTIGNQTAFVRPDGTFLVRNISVFRLRTTGIAPQLYRVRATCIRDDQMITGQSEFFSLTPGQTTFIADVFPSELDPIPVSIDVSSPADFVPLDSTVQLSVTATLPDGSTADVTARNAGTTYLSTNSNLLTVSEDGLITGANTTSFPRTGTIGVLNEGNLTTINFTATGPSNDFDNDGLPNDYEDLFGLNKFVNDANGDLDNDGLTNIEEFNLGTLPNNPDTDMDTIADGIDGDPLRPEESPPSVMIATPEDGATLFEGQTLTLSAEAFDDGLLTGIDFIVNGANIGFDTTPPFEALFTVPFATNTLEFTAEASDSVGNTATDVAFLSVIPDPLTIVQGLVVDPDTNPVAGADVALKLSGLKAEFFDFTVPLSDFPDLTGLAPDETKRVSAINFINPNNLLSLDTFGVGLSPDFAARFTGLIQASTSGSYTFTLGADDGAKLTINGTPVVEVVGSDNFTEATGDITLSAGTLPIEIDYFQADGSAELTLAVRAPQDSTESIVPPSDLLQNPDPFTILTGVDGLFSIPNVPTILGDVQARAMATIDGEDATGVSQVVQTVPDGVTDLDTITVQTTQAIVWGAQPATGNIIMINPATGTLLGSFLAPGTLSAENENIGLSIAEDGTSLIYQNSDDNANSTTLYRIDPVTGTILSAEQGDSFQLDGISYQTDGDVDYVYYSDPFVDLHRQLGFGGFVTFFWETGAPVGGLGGDGNGREFGFFSDGMIHEYDPFISDGLFTSTLPAPASDIEGLAFDGAFLYVSTTQGTLFTLDPNTGAVLNSVEVLGGALFGLGANDSSLP